MTKLLSGDGQSDKGNCTAGQAEAHGYQGLPKGSVRKGYQGNREGFCLPLTIYLTTNWLRKLPAQIMAQSIPTGAERIAQPAVYRFKNRSKNGKPSPRMNPATADSIMSLLVERIRGLRFTKNAPPTRPARKPNDPKETAVIGRTSTVVLARSHGVGDRVCTIGRTALRAVNVAAEVTVARMADHKAIFKIRPRSRAWLSVMVGNSATQTFYPCMSKTPALFVLFPPVRMLESNFQA